MIDLEQFEQRAFYGADNDSRHALVTVAELKMLLSELKAARQRLALHEKLFDRIGKMATRMALPLRPGHCDYISKSSGAEYILETVQIAATSPQADK